MKRSERHKDLQAKGAADLQKELNELLREHFNLRMQKATQQLQNTSKLGQVRRDIARVRTLLGQKAGQA
jgi:large subunit ribosomal protein L29